MTMKQEPQTYAPHRPSFLDIMHGTRQATVGPWPQGGKGAQIFKLATISECLCYKMTQIVKNVSPSRDPEAQLYPLPMEPAGAVWLCKNVDAEALCQCRSAIKKSTTLADQVLVM